MPRPLSFRARILLIVLAFAVVPLALLGFWLTRGTARSGEELLRRRLEESLDQTASQVVTRWISLRSALLFLTEDPDVQHALGRSPDSLGAEGPRRIFRELDASVRSVAVMDTAGREYFRLARGAADEGALQAFPPPLRVPMEVRDRSSGRLLGTMEVSLSIAALLPPGSVPPAVAGMILGIFEPGTGVSVSPLPVDPSLLDGEDFDWGGDRWLASERTIQDPPIRMVVAAPLSPFTEPFRAAARRSTWMLLVVALAGLGLAALLATRLTRSLEQLATAAEAVSRGELSQRVEIVRDDEVGRVAQAFNAMTESLQRTLRQLSSQESLAAVGEFAASLAHEVRNPLTAIRLDLQLAEEGLAEGTPEHEAQARALREIVRLDDTVTKALRVARSGERKSSLVDVREPMGAAADAALPTFRERGADLVVEVGELALPVAGDAGDLEQLFLNLLQNAAHALDPRGEARMGAEVLADCVVVTIRDTGHGVPAEIRHGGEIEIESTPGRGTTVIVRLPLGRDSGESDSSMSRSEASL
jgi:signal transduction histidine kinase